MLWKKTWLETRGRFVTALLILTVLAGSTVFEYVLAQRMMPLAESMIETDTSPLGAAIREAVAVQREFRGFVWYNGFRDNLTSLGVLFAVLLGCGGLLAEAKKGSALFTLSLPVTRKQLLGARVGVGLAQCFAIAIVPPLVIPLLAPAAGQSFSVVDALVHGLCLFFVGALFFSLASFLSTLFGDIWRPLLIAVFIGCLAAIVQFVAPEMGLFKVMSGEAYFRNGTLPWMGLVTTAVLASALLYSAAETLERRDF